MRRNTEARWGSVSITLHWLVALLILLVQVPAGLVMLRLEPGVFQNVLFDLHKNVGLVVLALAVFRLGWRLAQPVPALPDEVPGWQARLAGLTHVLLYGLLLLLPVSGFLYTAFGGYPVPLLMAVDLGRLIAASEPQAVVWRAIHYWAQWALLAVAAVHVLAALHHALVRRDGVLGRMLTSA